MLGATDAAKEHALLLARLYVQVDDADRLAVKSRDKAYAALETARAGAITLRGTDWVGGRLPWVRHNGGLVTVCGRRAA